MFNRKRLAIALAGSAIVVAPAQAQLLGGGSGSLGGAVSGALGGSGNASGGGLLGSGSIVGNATGAIDNSLSGSVTSRRSVDTGNGNASANAGLAGSVSSVASSAVGADGLGNSIGLQCHLDRCCWLGETGH